VDLLVVMPPTSKSRRVLSVSIYCRHQRSVLLIQQASSEAWVPLEGPVSQEETPLEAAWRHLEVEAGYREQILFPTIHKVLGAPPGLLLYEEHDGDDGQLLMNFAFVVGVPSKSVQLRQAFNGLLWVDSMAKVPDGCPTHVQQALMYALVAGRESIIPTA